MNTQTISNDTFGAVSKRSLSSEAKNLITVGSEKIVKDMDYLLKGYDLNAIQGTISRSISSILRVYTEEPGEGKLDSPIKKLTETKVPYHTQYLVQEIIEELVGSVDQLKGTSKTKQITGTIVQSIIATLRGYIEEKNGQI